MDIRPWLQELYAPAVLVATTPAAEAILQVKNGLTLVDLLRPYGSLYQLNAPVRVGESAVRVQELRVRFYDVATFFQPPPEVIEEHLQGVLKAAAQHHAKLEPAPELLQRLKSDNPPDIRELTPWYDSYRAEFLRLLRFGDHEALDYPVACVFAIPADVASPASHFDTLVAQLVPPPLMQQDVMYSIRDKDFPRHYVLLLDVAAGMNEKRALDNLAAIRRLYGEGHCSLLRLNSGNGDRMHSGAPVDFFARYQRPCLPGGGGGEPMSRPPSPPGGVGAYLTVQDLDAVGATVRELVTRTLLPRLEERIARLNASITATRRGLRNRLNRFWKGSAEDRQSDRPYPWHSVEGQLRQLADLAFLLRQYPFAESMYRLAAQDYLSEGSNKWYAGAEEMIGLCGVLGEPTDPIAAVLLQNDPMKYFLRAYEHYAKPPTAATAAAAAAVLGAGAPAAAGAGPPGAPLPAGVVAAGKLGRMLATRVIMLGAAVQSAAGRHRGCSEALMRAQSEEEHARAGLLLEQSAYAMLYARPPLARKFAFHLVLAGIRYICCGQKRIAIHAYRTVLNMYLGRKWRYIEEHLHAVLGAQCVEYGDKEQALWHYCALLDCSHRPAAQQASNVAQFLNLLAGVRDQLAVTHDGVSLVDSLPLPLVARHDVRVLCSDTAAYAGPTARAVPDSTWLKMEACCTSGSNNWLVEGGNKQERDHEEYTMCVCGEEVGVQVEFRNPLSAKLKVTNVKLICSFTPEGEAGPGSAPVALPADAAEEASTSGGGSTSADGLHPLLPGAAPSAIGPQPGREYIHVAVAQFTLHPGEALQEVLRVLPRAPGWLRVTGVTWTLNGVAHGRMTFDVKGRRRKKPKGDRPGQLKHYPPHRRLLFQVVPPMPRLELLEDPLPPSLYSGELCRVMMRVRNSGGLPLRSLALVVGHAEAVCPATDANKDRPLLESLADPREVVQQSEGGPAASRGWAQLYRLWPGRELAPGEVLEWPLWLHPRGVGTLKLPLVWYGEPVASKGGMRHRTLRICGSVSVLPLLAARPSVYPSPTALSHHMVRLAVDNSKDGERVVLQQLAAITVPPSSLVKPPPPTRTARRSGLATPPCPPGTLTPPGRPPPEGWRLSLLNGHQSASPTASAAEAAAAAGAQGPGSSRSLPLALPLQAGEGTSLYLQLMAPPSQPQPQQQQQQQQQPSGAHTHAASGQGATPGGGPSAPPSGMATPGRQQDAAAIASAVAQAAEAVRGLALAEGGGGGGGRALPYVDGSDASLQRLNLFGPGVLAHFYRKSRKGMFATGGGGGEGAAPALAPGAGASAGGGGAPQPSGPPGPPSQPGPYPMQQPGGQGGPHRGPGTAGAFPPQGPPSLGHSASFGPGQQGPPMPAGAYTQQNQQQPGPLARSSTLNHAPLPASGPGGGPPGAYGGPGGPGRPAAPGAGPSAAPVPSASGPGRPGVRLPLADPQLDLLLLWHVAASQRTGHHQGSQRLGLCRPYDPATARDLSACLQASMTPIRMILTGPNGASSSSGSAGPVIRNDFRKSTLAVVPLRLHVRNNTALEARLQIEVGDPWQSAEAPHSWQAATTVPAAGPGGGSGPPQAGAALGPASAGPTGGGLYGASAGPYGGGPSAAGGGPGGQAAGAGGGAGLGGNLMAITYQAGLPPCPEYAWVGPACVTVPRLEPGGVAEVQLAVCVFRPGTYCVSGYRCTAFLATPGPGPGVAEVQRGDPLCFRVEG